jgi:hypothetical protein
MSTTDAKLLQVVMAHPNCRALNNTAEHGIHRVRSNVLRVGICCHNI